MADNVIPFPIERRRPENATTGADSVDDASAPVTREEMIRLVLRYAYGGQWAHEPPTTDAADDDPAPGDRAS